MSTTRNQKQCRAIELYHREHGATATRAHFSITKGQLDGVMGRVRRGRAKHFSPERVQKIRRMAMKVTFKDYQQAEDFGSYVVVRALEGRAINIQHLKVDFLRECYGRNGTKGKEELPGEDLKDIADREEARPDCIGLGWNALANRFRFDISCRVVFMLTYKWSMASAEIAEVMGLSPSRISQILTEVKEKITIVMEREKS